MVLKSNFKCLYYSRSNARILPGSNVFPDKEGEELLKCDDIKDLIEVGRLEVVAVKADPKEVASVKEEKKELPPAKASAVEIRKLNVKDAKAVVDGLVDISVLRELAELDKRPAMAKAIEKQIAKATDHRGERDED